MHYTFKIIGIMMIAWIMYDDEMNKKASESGERDRWLRERREQGVNK
jgi:hypothetical protein